MLTTCVFMNGMGWPAHNILHRSAISLAESACHRYRAVTQFIDHQFGRMHNATASHARQDENHVCDSRVSKHGRRLRPTLACTQYRACARGFHYEATTHSADQRVHECVYVSLDRQSRGAPSELGDDIVLIINASVIEALHAV